MTNVPRCSPRFNTVGRSDSDLGQPDNPESGSLRAELTGSDTCIATGLTVHARAPVLTMCREMLATGLDPDRALEVYRNGVLSLRIRSIGEGAKLAVEECSDGVPRFRPYRPHPSAGSPPMRQTDTPHPVREATV